MGGTKLSLRRVILSTASLKAEKEEVMANKEVKQYVDPKKATPQQIQEALALLNKKIDRQEKIKRGEIKGGKKWSELSEAEKNKFRAANARRNAHNKLVIEKAVKAGIKVTEAEVDAYLKKG